jgi:hypothetical protein
MNWLITIATLCQISETGNLNRDSHRKQLYCQQELLKCMRAEPYWRPAWEDRLADCVMKASPY